MKLKLSSGLTYCYGADNHKICTGSQMGRSNEFPEDLDESAPIKLRMEKLKWVDGDYDQWGTYWGHGKGDTDVYCAWNEEVKIFVRGWHRESAKQGVWKILPHAIFYR